MFSHLHVHSCYSLLEGMALPSELAAAAQAAGMPALALTDHRMLTGAVEFYLACQKAGVQPVLGLEVDLDMQPFAPKMALLAQDLAGWSNLCRLSTALNLRPDPEAPVSLNLLSAHSGRLLALCTDLGDPDGQRLAQMAEIFPDQLYVELINPQGKQRAAMLHTAALAARLKLPCVAAQPVYYLAPEQAGLQRTLAAIRLNTTLSSLPPGAEAPAGSYFASCAEMQTWFQDVPAALQGVEEVVSRCRCELPIGVPHYPQVPLPPGMSAAQFLRQKAEAGAQQIYGAMTPELHARLDHELEVIAAHGFEGVFLIVEEILSFARQSGIPHSSRGSAASSLVAHCLGITSPDPLRHNLYFERFLNPARSTPPDIDTDLCSRRRDEIIQHVFDACGEDRVAMVATINRFRPRSALGDVAKAHGLAPGLVRSLTKTLPYAFFQRMEAEDSETPLPSPFTDLAAAHTSPQYRQIFREAEQVLKQPRHLSVHAGGVVVAPMPLLDLVPLMRSGNKGVIITQFDLESVERLGLVKIDLLGIRGLTVLGDVAEAVYSWRRKEYSSVLDVLEAVPSEDEETAQRVEHGQTIGCFQIESPGMRAVLREIRARSIEDIIAALALYRPGPLKGGLKDAFVRRFKGEEPVAHLHPALAPLLDETYGVILYQEQVLKLAHELAGFSLAEADLLRRGMSHFDPGKQMQALQQRFINGAVEKSGVPPETGQRLWEMMAAFAGYGFPKAHAASYALVAWRSAWCKTHFPAEFMSAVMANWGGYYSQRVYLSEARRMGLTVRAPQVNHARGQFSVCYPDGEPVLYMGLDQVRDLTRRTQERIIRGRPFSSLEDFLTRVDPHRQEAENLALAGAFEGLATIPAVLERLKTSGWQAGQLSLFDFSSAELEDWTLGQKVAAQQEVLGVSLDAHPLELVADQVAAAHACTTLEAAGRVGQRVTVAGIRQTLHRSRTARGESMAFLTLEDLEGALDVVIFPDVYHKARAVVGVSAPLLVTGVVEMDESRGEPLLRAQAVDLL